MRTLITTVAGAQFKAQHQATEEFWRRLAASNGGRQGDPHDYAEIVDIYYDEGRGWVIEYEVPAELLEQRAVSVIREDPEPNCQNVLEPAKLAEPTPPQAEPVFESVDGEQRPIPVKDVMITGWNPRKAFDAEALQALAEDIRQNGLINPIMVRPKGKRYELVAGERRLRAFRLLGRTTIPAKVRELTDEQVLDIMLAENLQRVDLNPIEEAHHLKRVLEVGKLTQTELGRRIGKSQEWVSQRLRLAEAPAGLQDEIIRRRINPSAAADLLAWKDTDHFGLLLLRVDEAIREEVEAGGLGVTVKRVREIIKEITEPVAERLPREATPDISVAPPLNGEITEPTDLPFVNPEDCKDCDIYDRENDKCPEGCTCDEECEDCFCERPEDEDEGEKQDLPQEPEPAAEAEKEPDVPEENVPSEPTMLDGHRKLLAAAKEGADGVNQWKCNICGHGFTVKPERADNVARMLEHLCNRLIFDSPGQATGEHRDALRRVSRAIAEGGDTWGLLQKLFHQAGPEGN